MKIIMCLIALVILTGCGKSVTSQNIKKAEEVCAVNGGIRDVFRNALDEHLIEVTCNNDAYFRTNSKDVK